MPLFKSSFKKKKDKRNYQDILYDYLKMLLSSQNLLKLISKEIKARFFMNMNDTTVNNNDELKYFILMKENYRKYKIKTNFFQRWKRALNLNENSIKENDSFENNNSLMNYNLFKSVNSLSGFHKLKLINSYNINDKNRSFMRYQSENQIENEYKENGKTDIFNNWKDDIKICKNNNIELIGNYNKNIEKEFKKENFNIFLRGSNKINNSISDNKNNLFNDMTKFYKDILRITKNKELKIINSFSEGNKEFKIIENGLNNVQQIKQNFEIHEKNNDIMNKNKKIKNIKIKDDRSCNGNNINKGNKFMENILLMLFLILLGAFIINELNIDNF